MRQVSLLKDSKEYLTRTFLPAVVVFEAGDGVCPDFSRKVGDLSMRTYEVRVLVPKLELIEAENEADLFEKVGKLYKELYRHEARALVEILPEPEDFP